MQADRANTSLTPRVAFAEGLSENKSHLNEPCPDAKSAPVAVADCGSSARSSGRIRGVKYR